MSWFWFSRKKSGSCPGAEIVEKSRIRGVCAEGLYPPRPAAVSFFLIILHLLFFGVKQFLLGAGFLCVCMCLYWSNPNKIQCIINIFVAYGADKSVLKHISISIPFSLYFFLPSL